MQLNAPGTTHNHDNMVTCADQTKVEALMQSIQEIGLQEPIGERTS
jgi:hypothetical protein